MVLFTDSDQEEAVRENLKNVLLFMSSSGYLVSPKQEPSKEQLWTETWKRIDRFLPDLRSELALDEDDEPEKTAEVQEAAPLQPAALPTEEKAEEKETKEAETEA